MEKIAIISDIHGNITALNEVLKDIEKRGINPLLIFHKTTIFLGQLTIQYIDLCN